MSYPLTVEDFRLYTESGLEDEVIEAMLAAAAFTIDDLLGPVEEATEVHDGGGSYLFLRRRASAIDSVTETVGETDTTLDGTDHRLRGDRVSLLRLGTGTNQRSLWGAPVTVVYTPVDDSVDRERVQVALVDLDINHVPGGVTAETIGSWLEQRASNSAWNYTEERDSILASLAGFVPALPPGFA